MNTASSPSTAPAPEELSPRQRWTALWVVCVGTLMIVLDTTIVNVALPSIQRDLGFSEAGLAWVVNAYLLCFGGCLLLFGRLGDWYGHRTVFIAGLAVFTAASLACGLAGSQALLLTARALQGLGGAAVDAAALALLMALFTSDIERAKAMGIYGFVCAGGGAVGVLAGGVITHQFGWAWTFLVNVPIGLAVLALAWTRLPKPATQLAVKLDVWGSVSMTLALALLVYGVIHANEWGWLSAATLGTLAAGVLVLLGFVWIESRASAPLLPFALLRGNNLPVAATVGTLWAASMFAWFFLVALYMQQVLGYDPLQVGLAFLPANLIMAAFSISVSAKLVLRFGNRLTLAAGMALVAVSLLPLAFLGTTVSFWTQILPSMCLLGVGCGMAMNPIMMAAMDGVAESESGLASGIVNTAFMMGGALGLAILASLAASRNSDLLAQGASKTAALAGGYQLAFIVSAAAALLAAGLTLRWIRSYAAPAA